MQKLFLILLFLLMGIFSSAWAQTQSYNMTGNPTTATTRMNDANGKEIIITTILCDRSTTTNCFDLVCESEFLPSSSEKSFDLNLDSKGTLTYYQGETKIVTSGLIKRFKGDFFQKSSSFAIEMIK
ncbi:hypothetical protein H4K35_02810 [Myroides sp. NP-2]|uniref:hypothetical protein n=1 Tax=Myroides sp. NP-2 TaxID=2759945 RepID=UPI0015FE5BA4|nr:hypothetical protein [Myroides sp. NP-2]MBB1149068.1 hypothetical protein [Myroides sp. NP-2]